MSAVLKYFKKETKRGKAICLVNQCGAELDYHGFLTSGPIKHLRLVHSTTEEFPLPGSNKRQATIVAESQTYTKTKSQPSIKNFMVRESLSQIISKLMAADGFSAHAIKKSEFMRKAMILKCQKAK